MKKQGFFSIVLLIICLLQFCPVWALTTRTPANCTYTVTNGWTQTINYQCNNAINLNGAIIQFTVDNPSGLINPGNVWGFTNVPQYPLNPHLVVAGNTVTLALNFSSSTVTLPSNTTSNFSYSTGNNVNVTSFALYPAGSTGTSGTLSFLKNSASDPLPADTTIHVTGSSFSANVVFANQNTLNNIPFGTYQLSVTGTVNGQPASINITPNQVVLSSSAPTGTTSLSYKASAATLTISLPVTQPTDISSPTVLVTLTGPASPKQQMNVPWNGQATASGLLAGTQYTLSSNPINGQYTQYQFNISPSVFTAQAGQNNAMIGMKSISLPTGLANINVTGLPSAAYTALNFTYNNGSSDQVITMNNVGNGVHGYILPAGYQYTLTAQIVLANGQRYSATPLNLTINTNTTTAINLPFYVTAAQTVNGWPAYLAMGAVTDDSTTTVTSLQTRPVDAIFKYGGMSGNGDPGQIIYPIFDIETVQQAQTLTTHYKQNGSNIVVKPVMVIYTAYMSGGVNYGDFDYGNLVMHYITLLMEAQKLESYKTAQNPYPGAIILNPDLLGLVQQQNLTSQLNTIIKGISLQTALKTAICFITSTINTSYGANLNYEQLFEAILAQAGGIWSAMNIWDTYKMQYYTNCTANPVIPANITIPAFTNDFPGWIQSTNWLIRRFAPDITFGWQENLWATGTSNWVHQNYSASDLQSQISAPVAAALKATTAYSGNYLPDFLVFDKFEMDAIPDAAGSGYLFNARDWTNVLAHINNVSISLGSVPIMLWQIPGGHLQQTNDIDTRTSHASTEPDFFFGDTLNPLLNFKSWITSVQLPSSIYGTSNIVTYLSMNTTGNANNYTWINSNLQQAANNHVFAILWGGGNTTSVSSFPSDDGGWLANKIMAYYKNPVMLFSKTSRSSNKVTQARLVRLH